MAWSCSGRWCASRKPKPDVALGVGASARYRAAMRALGLLLLLFGLGTLAIHFMEVKVEWLEWIGNWGENVAWAIRGGAVVLGLLFLMTGKKKGGGKK